MVEKVERSEEEWAEVLTPAQYEVLRRKGTEPPFSGDLNYNKATGTYVCGACGAPLFTSETKFESHSGWPSFYEPAVAEAVDTHEDTSLGMRRIEVTCARCGGHLGHVFPDGPNPTGLRYCINSLALGFEPDEADAG
jgi:peptide-methionine (R)-S-oxide reductase